MIRRLSSLFAAALSWLPRCSMALEAERVEVRRALAARSVPGRG